MRKDTREAITQAEQAHLQHEKGVVSATPAAEVRACSDRRVSDADKEDTRRPVLVVQRQQTERGTPDAQLSQMEKRAIADAACPRSEENQDIDEKKRARRTGPVQGDSCRGSIAVHQVYSSR